MSIYAASQKELPSFQTYPRAAHSEDEEFTFEPF
jgi:hypothetical protein